uniref:Uncharacterized protein n=1 Tax=Meloidogyne enterolobii TaxID=390850 RepID=A0A6V7VVW5_MELEN|nr:unnamed protein product [Meloidogyne enterolobii]
MSPSSFTLTAVLLEAIVFLYNRQVAAMLSMHPSCSGRSSTIENKLKMSGGGNGINKFTPGNVSFPVACQYHSKNLKATNKKEYKISEDLPMNQEKLTKSKGNDLIHKVKKIDKGNEAAVPYNTNKNNEIGDGAENEKAVKIKEIFFTEEQKKMSSEEFEHYLYSNIGEFKIQTGLVYRNNSFNSAQDDSKNLLNISHILMGLNENERDSQENLKNAADLFVALHECYQLFSVIPLVFEVEMVLKKLEEEGNKDDPIKLLEYFRLPTIKYPLLDLLKIEVLIILTPEDLSCPFNHLTLYLMFFRLF